MKKRILSALIALSMLFSVIPVMPVMTASADPTATEISTESQEILEYVKFTVGSDGKIDSMTLKPGASAVVTRDIGIFVVSKSEVSEGSNDYDDNESSMREWALGIAGDDFTGEGTLQQPAVRFILPANTLSANVEYTINAPDADNGMYFTSEGVSTNAESGYEKSANDPFEVYIIIAGAGNDAGTEQIYSQMLTLDADTGVGVNTDPPPVSGGGGATPEPTAAPKITGVTLGDVTSAGLTSIPGVAGVTSTPTGASASDVDVSYTWNPTTGGGSGATFPTAPGAYTVTATIAAASGSSYTLDSTANVSNTGGWTPGSGWTATANITIPKIPITSVTMGSFTSSLTDGDSYTAPAVSAMGTGNATYTGITSGIANATLDKSTASTSDSDVTATIIIPSGSRDTYKFDSGSLPSISGWTNVSYVNDYTITAKHAVTVSASTVTATNVTVAGTAPSDGATIATADFTVSTTTSGAQLDKTVVWSDASDGTFKPGKTYTATITVTPKASTNTVLGGSGTTTVVTSGITGFDTSGVNVTSNTVSSVVVTAQVTIPNRTITTIGATVAAPTVGQNPPENATSISVSDGTHSESVSNASLSSFAPTTGSGKVAAGTGNWTTQFTVNAPTGYKFNEAANAYSSSNTTVSGWTVTGVTVASGGGSATVSLSKAQTAKKITALLSSAAMTVNKNIGETVAANDLDDVAVTITYNDGTTDTANYTKSTDSWDKTNFSLVADTGTPSASSVSAVGLTSSTADNYSVYVKYTGSDLDTGVNPYVGVGQIDFAPAALTAASVSFAYPSVGATNTATAPTIPGGSHYTAGNIVWSKATPEYGDTITAQITLSADTTNGYNFSEANDSVSVTATNSGTSTLSPATNPIVTKSTDSGATVTVTYSFTMPAAPTVSTTDAYDWYGDGSSRGNAVALTLSSAATVTGVTINDGTSDHALTATTDYMASGTTITLNAAALNTLYGTPTDPDTTGATWTAKVSLAGLSGTQNANFTAKNTSPYLKITSDSKAMTAGGVAASTTQMPVAKGSVALVATDADSGHLKQVNWTKTGDGTLGSSTTKNNTITMAAGEIATVKADYEYYTQSVLVVTKTGNGSYTVKKGGSPISNNSTADHYDIWEDETYTVEATATNQNYVSTFTGSDSAPDLTSKPLTASGTIATPAADKTVNIAFTARTDPTVSPASATFTKDSSTADETVAVTMGDYANATITSSPAGAPAMSASSISADGNLTITAANMQNASPGTYTYTFNFGEGMTKTFELEVKAALSIDSVTGPSATFNHGDAFNPAGIAFAVTQNGTTTTYSYNSGASNNGWDKALPANTTFDIGGNDGLSPAAFDTYVKANTTIARKDAKNPTVAINNGDTITVHIGSKSNTSGNITVNAKALTLTDNATITKVYDGTDTVTTARNVAALTGVVSGDTVSFASADAAYDNKNVGTTKAIIYTNVTLDGADAGNYTATFNTKTGAITAKPITVTKLWPVEHASAGDTTTITGTGSVTINAGSTSASTNHSGTGNDINHETIVDAAPHDNLTITYTYTFTNYATGDSVDEQVSITNIACSDTNYAVTPNSLSDQHGYVAKRGVSSVAITAPTKDYYYTDTIGDNDVEIVVTWTTGTPTTSTYHLNDLPTGMDVKWVDASGADVKTTIPTPLTVKDHNGKKLYVAYEGQTGVSTGTVTVKPIPVTATAKGTLTREYDGTTSFNIASGITVGSNASFNDGTVTFNGTGTVSTPMQTAIGNLTVAAPTAGTGTVPSANASTTAQTVSIANSSYGLTSSDTTIDVSKEFALTVTSNVTGTINKRKIKVTAVTGVPAIWQGASVLTGSASGVDAGDSGKNITTAAATSGLTGGVMGGDTVKIDYSYAYPDSSATGTRTDVNITSTPKFTISAGDANYELDNANSVATGTGEVTARTLSDITVTSPTQFTNSQANPIVYNGTANTINLAGLEVHLDYGPYGIDKYTYNATNDNWDMTTTHSGGTAQNGIATSAVPFTLSSDHGVDVKDSTIVYAMNGDKITVTSGAKTKDTATLKVAQKELKFNITTTDTNGFDKPYDSTTTVTATPLSATLDTSTAPAAGDTVTISGITGNYDNANVAYSGTTIGNKTITFAATVTGNDANNYKITINNGTGKITCKKIKVTAAYVEAVDQFATNTFAETTVFGSATASNPSGYVVIDTTDGFITESDKNNTMFYLHGYYDDVSTPGNNIDITGKHNADNSRKSEVLLATTGGNYEIDTTVPTTIYGTVKAQTPSGINITSTFANKEYGDWLDASMTVNVTYGSPTTTTETYTFNGTGWTKQVGSGAATATTYDNLPFTLAWSGGTFNDTPTDRAVSDSTVTHHNAVLTTVGTYTLTATTKQGSNADTATQTVTKRNVDVTPSITGGGANVTKVYDATIGVDAGKITYTSALPTGASCDSSISSALPTATATALYNSRYASTNAAGGVTPATQVNITDATFGTDNDKFTANLTANSLPGEITKRPLKLTDITNVIDANQFSSEGPHHGTATNTNGATFESGVANEGIAGSDVVTVGYNYNISSTATAGTDNATATIVTDSVVFEDTTAAVNGNYNLTVQYPITDTISIIAQSVTVTVVQNPTSLDSSSGTAKYGDNLDITGLIVKVQVGDHATFYQATQNGTGDVTWKYGTSQASITIDTTSVPFTLGMENAGGKSASIDKTTNAGTKVDVPNYNGNKIVATHTGDTTAKGTGAALKVSPIEITAVTATNSGTIEKVYDGSTTVETDDAAGITYAGTGVLTTDTGNVAITATPVYHSKNAVASIAIDFGAPSLTNNYNGNYKLASTATVTTTDITGAITAKPVTVEYVGAPSIPTSNAGADVTKNVTNATVGTAMKSAYKSANDGQVVLKTGTGFVNSTEAAHYKFNYDVKYPGSAIDVTSNTALSVTGGLVVTPGTTTTDDSTNYPLTNYNITYDVKNDQEGYILSNVPTSFDVDPPTNAQTGYKHGDALNLAGLKVTAHNSNGTDTIYQVVADGTGYKWVDGSSNNIDLSSNGVTIKIGDVDISSNAAVSGKAHYTKMNGKTITASISGVSGDKTSSTLTVAKKHLTPVVTVTDTDKLTKTYDGNTTVTDAATNIAFSIDATTPVASFDGTDDVVTITGNVAYADKNVAYDSATPPAVTDKSINVTGLALGGTDSGNYELDTANLTAPASTTYLNADKTLKGKINPFAIEITVVGDAIPAATRNDTDDPSDPAVKTKTSGELTTTNYTTDPATIPDSAKPTLKYKYKYLDVTSVTNNATVEIIDASISDTNYLPTYNIDDKTGVVQGKTITGLAIKTQPTHIGTDNYGTGQLVYGDTADLAGLEVTVTYDDHTSEDVAYGSATWTNLDLKIADDSQIKQGDTLRVGTDKVATVTTSATTNPPTATTDSFKVLPRRVYATSTAADTITKAWDGDATVDQSITATISGLGNDTVDGVAYEGLLAGDQGDGAGISGTGVYAYGEKPAAGGNPAVPATEVGTDKPVVYTSGFDITGSNGNQYTVVASPLTGDITSQTVYVTILDPDNEFQLKRDLQNPAAWSMPVPREVDSDQITKIKLTTDDAGNTAATVPNTVKFKYKFALSAAQKGAANSYTMNAATTTNFETAPTAGTGGNYDTYACQVTGNDDNHYNFVWKPFTIQVVEDGIQYITITTPPTDMNGAVGNTKTKTYGDSFSFNGMEVTVTTMGGATYTLPWDDSDTAKVQEWESMGLQYPTFAGSGVDAPTKVRDGSGNLTSYNYPLLKVGDYGKVKVVCTSSVPKTAATTQKLVVEKKKLTITMDATSFTKEYDSTEDLNATNLGTVHLTYNGLLTGDTIDSTGDIKGKYYKETTTGGVTTLTATSHHDEATKAKLDPLNIKIKNGTTILTNQYEIIEPAAVTGTITQKEIAVSVDKVPWIGLKKGTVTEAERKVPILGPHYTPAVLTGDNAYVDLVGLYPDDISTEGEKAVTISIAHEYNNEHGDYKFTPPTTPQTGRVVNPSISGIKIKTGPKTDYIHGEKFELGNVVLEITTTKVIDESTETHQTVTLTRDKTKDDTTQKRWTVSEDATTGAPFEYGGDNNITALSDAEIASILGMSFFIEKTGTPRTKLTNDQTKLRRDTNDGGEFIVEANSKVSTKDATANPNTVIKVDPAVINAVSVAYATGKDHTDIEKTYDGTTAIETDDEKYIVYTVTDPATDIKFRTALGDAVEDTVTIGPKKDTHPATYSVKNQGTSKLDFDLTKLAVLETNGKESVNYVLKTNASNEPDFPLNNKDYMFGDISKRGLNIVVSDANVPPAFETDVNNALIKTVTGYTATGYADGETASTIGLKVTATYNAISEYNTPELRAKAPVTIAQSCTGANNSAEKTAYDNYEITINPTANGSVTDKPITEIKITGKPTQTEYLHKDAVDMDGFEVRVKKTAGGIDSYEKYKFSKDTGWAKTTSDTADGTYTADGGWDHALPFVVTWGNTGNAVQAFALEEKIGLKDTDKGLSAPAADGSKTTKLTVTSTVQNEAGTFETNTSTDMVKVSKKPLGMTATGDVKKVYDGDKALKTEKPALTLTNLVSGDDVEVDMDNTSITYQGTGAKSAGVNEATGDPAKYPALTIGTVAIKGDDADCYIAPAAADITNTTTGQIMKRKIKVTEIKNNLDTAIGADQQGSLTNVAVAASETATEGYVIASDTTPADNNGAAFWPIVSGETVTLTELPYKYAQTTDQERLGVSVEFGEAYTVGATQHKLTWDNTNYDVVLGITKTADITNGAVDSIKVEGPTKKLYKHGEQIDLDGAIVTVTHVGSTDSAPKYEKYTFDKATGKWRLNRNGVDQAGTIELPDEISLHLGTSGTSKVAVEDDLNLTPATPPAKQPTTLLIDENVEVGDTTTNRDVLGTGDNDFFAVYVVDPDDTTKNKVSTNNPTIKVEPIDVTLFVDNYRKADNSLDADYAVERVYDGTADVDINYLHIYDNLKDDPTTPTANDGKQYGTEATDNKVAIQDDYPTKPTLSAVTATAVFKDGADVKYNGTTVTTKEIELQNGYKIMNTAVTPAAESKHYKLTVVNRAVGKVTPKTLNVEVTVPSVTQYGNANATEADKPIAATGNYKSADLLNGDDVNITYNVDYADVSTTGDKTAFTEKAAATLGGAKVGNYNLGTVTYKGHVNPLTSDTITITKAPDKDPTKYKSGDTIDYTGMTVSVGEKTGIVYSTDPDSDWVKLGLTVVESGSKNPGDAVKTANNGDTITVKQGDTTSTNNLTLNVAKRKIAVIADGTPDVTKQYDGTPDVTPGSFTISIPDNPPEGYDDLLPGDKAKHPQPSDNGFKFVEIGEDGKPTATDAKDANTTDKPKYKVVPKSDIILTADDLEGEYDLEFATDLEGTIDKKQITPVIVDAGIKTSDSQSVSRTGIALADTPAAGKYTVTGITDADKAILTAAGVTIKYTADYPVPLTAGVDQALTNVNAEIEGDNAKNFTIVRPTATGTVTQKATGGGGGGGGGSNALVAHFKNEDGTAGAEAVTIEVPVGTDPIPLMGVFKSKPTDTTVLWTSSDEKVATVDEDGVVTVVGEGEAIITAQSKKLKNLTDKVTIKVTNQQATPTPEPTEAPTPTDAPVRVHERERDSLITKTMLNPYIVGYDNYVFGPELPISREELSAIFARLIANNLYMDKNYDTSFPDVPEKWSKPYIGYLEGFNVVTGYEDGTFRPDQHITRAEMAVMMAKAEGYNIDPDISADEVDFPDVDAGYAAWSAAKAIQILSDLGIMDGYTDGTFRPGQPITRAETVAVVNRVLAAQEVASYDVLPSDVTTDHWAYNDIVFAMNYRVLKDNSADPNAFIWSEEFDKNMVKVTEKGETVKETVEGSGDETPDASPEPSASPDATAPEASPEETASPEPTATPKA